MTDISDPQMGELFQKKPPAQQTYRASIPAVDKLMRIAKEIQAGHYIETKETMDMNTAMFGAVALSLQGLYGVKND